VIDFNEISTHHLTPFVAQTSCLWEAMARKLGNVHPTVRFADLDHSHFVYSSLWLGVSATIFRTRFDNREVGQAIYHLTAPIRERVTPNTHLGIILLLAPLLCIQDEFHDSGAVHFGRHLPEFRLRSRLPAVLSGLTLEDAEFVYKTIREINPGGLGATPEQDVQTEPSVTLLEAMQLAADRDMIARQYANGYADVFDFGVPALLAAWQKFGSVEAAIIECQLKWMAAFPDSLIARKLGQPTAEEVQNRAQNVLLLGGLDTPQGRQAGVQLDAYLRSNGNKLNPGTTADLVAACLFVALRENKVKPSARFRWNVPDWL
jgi:triphosphoribosyl-dephospho-CoA synthase